MAHDSKPQIFTSFRGAAQEVQERNRYIRMMESDLPDALERGTPATIAWIKDYSDLVNDVDAGPDFRRVLRSFSMFNVAGQIYAPDYDVNNPDHRAQEIIWSFLKQISGDFPSSYTTIGHLSNKYFNLLDAQEAAAKGPAKPAPTPASP